MKWEKKDSLWRDYNLQSIMLGVLLLYLVLYFRFLTEFSILSRICLCISKMYSGPRSNIILKFTIIFHYLRFLYEYCSNSNCYSACVGYNRIRKVKCLIVSGCRMFFYTCCWILLNYLRSFCFLSLNITRELVHFQTPYPLTVLCYDIHKKLCVLLFYDFYAFSHHVFCMYRVSSIYICWVRQRHDK